MIQYHNYNKNKVKIIMTIDKKLYLKLEEILREDGEIILKLEDKKPMIIKKTIKKNTF